MPRAELPSTPAGWLAALAAALVGLLAGFLTVNALGRLTRG